MLYGFTRNALVVYPFMDDYSGRSSGYVDHVNRAASNLHTYLRNCSITYDCFATDDVARAVRQVPDRWLLTLNGGDMHFVKTNCEGMDLDFSNGVKYPDVYTATAERFPIERGASIDNRFEAILKRDAKARREIEKKYSLTIMFNQPKSPAMKLTPKAESGRLLILIDNTTFIAKCYMSDMLMDPIDLLGIPNANAPVYEWEVT
jgi:hypothetical protein